MNNTPEESGYKKAGVDLEAAKAAKDKFKAGVAGTFDSRVLSRVGSFGGMYSLAGTGFKEPVLVCSTDGVGTKLLVARMLGRHDTVGECLVNHCVNDIMVQGARPLFFMDYISVGRLSPDHVAEVMKGFVRGCTNNGIALIGGETAEMPDLYRDQDYDLAGFIVGAAERGSLITGERVSGGHVLIGLPSTGLHTNGYSLARKVLFTDCGLRVSDRMPWAGGETLGEILLRVHRSYRSPLEALFALGLADAAAHITGGGLTDNLPRVFPDSLDAVVQRGTWPVPPIFSYLAEKGKIGTEEMYRVFNMGIGMVVITAGAKADMVLEELKKLGEKAFVIGEMAPGSGRVLYH